LSVEIRSRRADFGDAFHPARRFDDLLQMCEVLDLDEGGSTHAAIDRLELHAADVRSGSGNSAGNICVEPAPIESLERAPRARSRWLRGSALEGR
jgi:hypothetical protein